MFHTTNQLKTLSCALVPMMSVRLWSFITLSVRLSVCHMSVCLSVSLSVSVSVPPSVICPSLCPSLSVCHLFISLSIRLSVSVICPSVSLSVRVSVRPSALVDPVIHCNLSLWTPSYLLPTPVRADLIFSILLLGADLIFANFPLAPDVFSSLKNAATPRELSCL